MILDFERRRDKEDGREKWWNEIQAKYKAEGDEAARAAGGEG